MTTGRPCASSRGPLGASGSTPGRKRFASRLLMVLGFVLSALVALPAAAQFGPGGMPGGAVPGTLPAQPAAGRSKQPETHAARGGDGQSTLPTQTAQLPQDPNAIPKKVKKRLGSDFDPNGREVRGKRSDHGLYGPYYFEKSKHYSFRGVFPGLWLERRQFIDGAWDRTSLFGLSYLNRRSKNFDADVLFPFFWHMRDRETYHTVVGPFRHSQGPKGHANWLAPLFFEGKSDTSSYLHIPPLLTFHTRNAKGGFSMAGPAFCKYEGGSFCDSRTASKLTMGIAPLYFYGRDQDSEFELIPPLLHYYSYSTKGERSLNIWGPLWMEKSRKGGVFNLMPLYWHNWSEDERNITFLPFFHYGKKGDASTLATPLFFNRHDEDGGHTFATYLYARHRGRTELDMYTPLVWHYRDPDIDLTRTAVLPFFYKESSPRSDDLVVFPFFGRFKRHGISETTWVTPLARHERNTEGWNFSFFPLLHMGRKNQSTHLVAAPLFWDFADANSRSTVAFPLFWRFRDKKGLSQLIGNAYYSEEKVKGGDSWQFHLFPLLSFGATPQGHWWNVLYGLAGYTREGTMAKMRLGYVPITLSKKER